MCRSREAYRIVGKEINEGSYKASRELKHSHEGSIGNLGNDLIVQQMDAAMAGFGMDRIRSGNGSAAGVTLTPRKFKTFGEFSKKVKPGQRPGFILFSM